MKTIRKQPGSRETRRQTWTSVWGPVWRHHGRRLALLWAITFVAYSNSFQAGLFFDNVPVILQDPRIQTATPRNIGLILTQGYWHVNPNSGLYRPVTTLSYLVNYSILGDGTNPPGYHWINLALHELNAALVYALGILVFGAADLALACAALWGAHPLLTESVTNIVGRADLLSALGVLAGLLCYVKGSAGGKRKLAWLTGLAVAQSTGLFSKENAVVLPGLMLLYDLTWKRRTSWRKRAPFYAALAFPFAAFFLIRAMHAPMLVEFNENPLTSAGFWTARLTAIKVIGKFLWLFIWPASLSADYSYDSIPLFGWRLQHWEDTKALISLAVCAAAMTLFFRWRRTHQPICFFTFFFFVTLVPTSNVIVLIGSIMAERFLYLPSIGLAGCVVAIVQAVIQVRPRFQHASRTAWIAAGVVCLALSARTYARNSDWQDELTLWTSAVNVNPGAARAHMNLGRVLSHAQDRLSGAVSEYQTALRIQPNSAQTHDNLGIALAQLPDRMQDAIAEYRAALRLEPASADAHNNLGIALSRLPGRLPDAIDEWREALRIQPDHAGAHYNLGDTLSRMPGRMPEAIAEWQAAVRSQPDLAEVHYNLGNALSPMPERLADAIAEYEAALRIEPDFAQAHNNLANALARTPGGLQDAIAHWQAAVRIQPGLAEAHYNLGSALSRIPGRLPDALSELEAGQRLRPDTAMKQFVDKLRAGQK